MVVRMASPSGSNPACQRGVNLAFTLQARTERLARPVAQGESQSRLGPATDKTQHALPICCPGSCRAEPPSARRCTLLRYQGYGDAVATPWINLTKRERTRARAQRLRLPSASPREGGGWYAPDPISERKKKKIRQKDFVFSSLLFSFSLDLTHDQWAQMWVGTASPEIISQYQYMMADTSPPRGILVARPSGPSA